MSAEKPNLIIKRSEPESHYELHFRDRVEFWTPEGKKLGVSKVEEVK